MGNGKYVNNSLEKDMMDVSDTVPLVLVSL